MKTFIVTVHLAGPDAARDFVTILTPSGIVEYRQPAIKELTPQNYGEVEQLIVRMFPGKKHKLHGAGLEYEVVVEGGGTLRVYRVDADD